MLACLGQFIVRRAKAVLAVAVVALVAAGIVGASAFGKLQSEGFNDPDAESTAAEQLIEEVNGTTGLLLLARATSGDIDDPAAVEAGRALVDRISDDVGAAGDVRSYWTTGAPTMKSQDGAQALVLVSLRHSDSDTADTGSAVDFSALAEEHAGQHGPLTVTAGGPEVVGDDVSEQVAQDLLLAESIAVPLILVLLVFAFGSLVAALLPLAIGAVAILGTFAELSVLGSLTDVSVFAINLTTALGLGLAIDYALLVVSRFREELDRDGDVGAAVVRTVQTAGRTVVFSGLAIAAALAALLVFPMYFLRSFAYAGIGVVAISVLAVVTVLPALLTVLGPRVNAGRAPWLKSARGTEAPFWGRLAARVMRRPLVFAVPFVALLAAAAVPLFGAQFGMPDDRVLPTSADSRQVGDALREDFPAGEANAIDVVTTGPVSDAALAAYAGRLSELPGVEQVVSRVGVFVAGGPSDAGGPGAQGGQAGGTADAAAGPEHLSVATVSDPASATALDLVDDVRGVTPPAGVDALAGGRSAQLLDSLSAVGDRLPVAIGLVAATTFVILFLFTGSIVQPIRALLSNSLTLAATGGIIVLVFQEGFLSSVLGFTPTPLETTSLVLLYCIAFGLSMDYEVFVISRIRERMEAGDTVEQATTVGLSRTGRIVTTAAALLSVSFFAFLVGEVSFLKMFGLGTGLAILLDATIVRGVLVPASMRLLGRNAWYAPRALRAVHARIGLSEA